MNRSLLCFFATLLLAGQAQAYVILESKYRVEVKPGVFEDQLVLKCDSGKKITVPWEARLSEACGEVDIPRAGTAAAAPRDDAEAQQQDSRERQKEIMMSRMREQFGDVDERHVTVESGLGGAEPHFSPQMREILKRYELCRKNTKGSPTCATERNQAMAALSASGPGNATAAAQSTGAEPQPAVKAKSAAKQKHKQPATKAAAKPAAPPAEPASAEAAPVNPEAEPTQAAMPAPPAAHGEPEAIPAAAAAAPAAAIPAPDRAAREEKIAQDYASCMRAKPKFECESARAAALKALDAPAKAKAKSKSAAKAVPAPAVAAN
jgi:hypothetical protein